MSKKNILITGDEGFIGSRMWAEFLLEYNLTGYDLIARKDIRNYFQLNETFRTNNFDTVIHLAARAGVRTGEQFPDEYISTNINGTQNVIRCCEEHGVKHLIFFSSSSVYGSQPSPNKETDEMKPDSLYGITKATGEMLVEKANIPKRTVVRPFTVYGENGRKDQVIYKWLDQIKNDIPITFFGDGSTKRGYTYVGDLVDGVKRLVDNKDGRGEGFEVFNLGGSEIISLNDLSNVFHKVKGDFFTNTLPLPKEDIPNNWGDISKAKELLNWEPSSNFDEKVTKILKDYE